jgi:hypothetical protein
VKENANLFVNFIAFIKGSFGIEILKFLAAYKEVDYLTARSTTTLELHTVAYFIREVRFISLSRLSCECASILK